MAEVLEFLFKHFWVSVELLFGTSIISFFIYKARKEIFGVLIKRQTTINNSLTDSKKKQLNHMDLSC
ncbi:MAG: hypothetical protein LBF97_00950 [Elusimicrobiota bacterium]|jgi:F0F1-type ATP synthase membrane subunit b/b'|nr:hypothetical protein [Elusimicrobiota bacterium]